MKGKLDAYVLAGVAAGFAAGGLCGYFLARRLGQKSFEARVTQEVASVKAYYQAKTKSESAPTDHLVEGATPVGTDSRGNPVYSVLDHKDIARKMEELRYSQGNRSAIVPGSVPEDPESGNILPGGSVTGDTGDTDPMAGISGDDPDDGDDSDNDDESDSENFPPFDPVESRGFEPYVITTEEFYEDKEHYHKISLTWYAADNILVDERDVPVHPAEGPKIVGPNFMNAFGQGSDDDRIVHIRNERIECDYEIAKHDGSYSEVVLGIGSSP